MSGFPLDFEGALRVARAEKAGIAKVTEVLADYPPEEALRVLLHVVDAMMTKEKARERAKMAEFERMLANARKHRTAAVAPTIERFGPHVASVTFIDIDGNAVRREERSGSGNVEMFIHENGELTAIEITDRVPAMRRILLELHDGVPRGAEELALAVYGDPSPDSMAKVRSHLANLKKDEQVERTARGVWTITALGREKTVEFGARRYR